MRSRGLTGIRLLGMLYIATSLLQMGSLVSFSYYVYLFHWLPEDVVKVRYGVSWCLRLVGVMVGVGLCYRKERARQAALVLSTFTLLTVYWKHPYATLERATAYLDGFLKQFPLGQQWLVTLSWTFSTRVLMAVILCCLGDVIFAGGVLYYLTRPHITQQFLPGRVRDPDAGSRRDMGR